MADLEHIWTAEDGAGRWETRLALLWGISRTRVQQWAEQGRVWCNGRAVEGRCKPKPGDVFRASPPETVPSHIEPEDLALDILFEDGAMIVLNKAPGVVVHPGAGRSTGTLVSALLHHCGDQLSGIGGVERPGIVHRLDRETSGVLVVAKTDAAHQHLSRQFRDRSLKKQYLAWVWGGPSAPAGSWTGPIGRHPVHRQKMAIRPGRGRTAHTDFRVIQRVGGASLLELDLYTGRTHQIRVHAAAAGCPVVGDGVYGGIRPKGKRAGVERQLLHAARIGLVHPVSEKDIEFTAPVPEDFVRFEAFLHAP